METAKEQVEIEITNSNNVSVNTSSFLPIFIMGVMPRSGTHFLSNLICLHPDCGKSAFDEDYLLAYADYLAKYANGLQNQWQLLNDVKDFQTKDLLMECLGNALISFLQQTRKKALETRAHKFNFDLPNESYDKRIVAKTPYVDNLNKFFKLFPKAHLLILIRDGRAVVESSVKSFQTNDELTTREWALSVDRILKFVDDHENKNHNYLIVRYEDLFLETEFNMRKVLDFLELDANSYDFQAASNVPVIGSSTYKRDESKGVNWDRVKKTEEFNPLARAVNWNRAKHERFNWLASKALKAFGYEPKIYSNNRLFWSFLNVLLDLKWSVKIWLLRIKKASLFVVKRLKTYQSNQ